MHYFVSEYIRSKLDGVIGGLTPNDNKIKSYIFQAPLFSSPDVKGGNSLQKW